MMWSIRSCLPIHLQRAKLTMREFSIRENCCLLDDKNRIVYSPKTQLMPYIAKKLCIYIDVLVKCFRRSQLFVFVALFDHLVLNCASENRKKYGCLLSLSKTQITTMATIAMILALSTLPGGTAHGLSWRCRVCCNCRLRSLVSSCQPRAAQLI